MAVVITAVSLGEGSFLKLTNGWKLSFLYSFGWIFILSFIWIIFFMLRIVFKHGNYRIGGPEAQPEFSTLTWISMLFSAGLGTGLMYAGTFDPMSHFFKAPQVAGLADADKLIRSLEITYLHWGLPAWFVYSATGLIFALMGFSFEKDFQFSALIPKRFNGFRIFVNIFAILSILIGVITTFAIAASQINAGLNRIFPVIKMSSLNSSLIIIFITFLATVSVVSGLKKGIKTLSQINVTLVLILFFYILFHTHIAEVVNLTLEVSGRHLTHFIQDLTYSSALKNKDWMGNWTILYWAWWGTWAPFVGLFIARISKGRTIKEFVLGAVLAPSIISCVWFTLFGYMGYRGYISGQINFGDLFETSPFYTLFSVLDLTILPTLASGLAVVCVTIFYVTSSDSGSYVVDMIASGGKKSPHSYLRIFWSLTEGLMALVLFYYGGVKLIQNLVILFSLPIILYLCFGIYKVEEKLIKSV